MAAKVLAFPVLYAAQKSKAEVEPPSDLKQRILAAAHALYIEPRKVAIADIAAAAGVPTADVESVFGDEPGVRRAVLSELLAFALAGHPCFGRPKP